MSAETMTFQAETARLLNLVATALYSNKEVFIRELVSNAADACDKLRFLSQSDASLMADGDGELRVTVSLDEDAGTLSFVDTGIGMSREELIDNLGTIAKSGTAAFAKNLADASSGNAEGGDKGGSTDASALIGQFGVGFYAAFVVADRVEVVSRRAGTSAVHRWTSDGQGEFSVEALADDSAPRGTTITLRLKDDASEFKNSYRVRSVIERYADHIAIPVYMAAPKPPATDGDGDGDGGTADDAAVEDALEQVNKADAIWRRSKDSVTDEQYTEHYRSVAATFDEPWEKIHLNAEGALEYSALLYIPSSKPYDLFNPERRTGTKLYVKRVFITDDCEELMPPYLRFVRGVVDSEDLPLNVSRELLQASPVLAKMKSTLTNRVLSLLAKKADKDPQAYASFYENFGAVMKEGLYEDFQAKDKLLPLVRFHSSRPVETATEDGQASGSTGLVSLADYIARMKEGQDKIYYITADNRDAAASSAHVEGFVARGLEVLYATDPVDAFWIPATGSFEGKQLVSVTQGSADLDAFEKIRADDDADKDATTASADEVKAAGDLVMRLKTTLGERVSDVRLTERLASSAVCVVAGEGGVDRRLEKILSSHQQPVPSAAPILEVNPNHKLIKHLGARVSGSGDTQALGDSDWTRWSEVLLDLALVQEGELPKQPAQFAREMQTLIAAGL